MTRWIIIDEVSEITPEKWALLTEIMDTMPDTIMDALPAFIAEPPKKPKRKRTVKKITTVRTLDYGPSSRMKRTLLGGVSRIALRS